MFLFPSLKRAIKGKLEYCTGNKLSFLEKGSLHWQDVEGGSEAYAEVLKAWFNIQVGKNCSVYAAFHKWVEEGPDLLNNITLGDSCRLEAETDLYRSIYCHLGDCCRLALAGSLRADTKTPLCIQGRNFCNVEIKSSYSPLFTKSLDTAFVGTSFDLEIVDNVSSITIEMKAKEGSIYVYHKGELIFELPEGEQRRSLVFGYLDKKSFKSYKFRKEVSSDSSIPKPIPA